VLSGQSQEIKIFKENFDGCSKTQNVEDEATPARSREPIQGSTGDRLHGVRRSSEASQDLSFMWNLQGKTANNRI